MSTMWIISGPPAVGKTTFMRTAYVRAVTGLEATPPRLRSYQFQEAPPAQLDDCLVHNNIMYPMGPLCWEGHPRSRQWLMRAGAALWVALRHHNRRWRCSYATLRGIRWDHPRWEVILRYPIEKKAVVLVASHEEIVRRRGRIAEHERAGHRKDAFLQSHLLSIYGRVDLSHIYAQWLSELRRQGIAYHLVNSTGPDYSPIDDEESIPDIIHAQGNGAI